MSKGLRDRWKRTGDPELQAAEAQQVRYSAALPAFNGLEPLPTHFNVRTTVVEGRDRGAMGKKMEAHEGPSFRRTAQRKRREIVPAS